MLLLIIILGDILMKKTLSALLLLTTFLSGTTMAGVIYSDSAAFNATLGTTIVDDYESSAYAFLQNDATMTNVLGETAYKATGHVNKNYVWLSQGNHLFCAGCNGSFLLNFASTSVSGANGVYGIGFDYRNSGNPLYNAFVTYGDGSTENFQLASVWNPNLKFWGITSDLEINSIHFGLANGGIAKQGSFSIDNLTIGNKASSVPEPSSILLLTLGLLGLSARRRKQ